MKKILITLSVSLLIIAGSLPSTAQNKKIEKEEEIILKKKGDKNVKMTIEINDDEVMINGKPMNEYNDENVKVDKRVRIIRDGDENLTISRNGKEKYFPGENGNDVRIKNLRGMLNEGEVRPFLGVTSEKNDKGAKITAVSKGSAAEKAGLKEGDIITKVESKKIEEPESLMDVVGDLKPKQDIKISYLRDGKSRDTKATLGERKDLVTGNYSFNRDWSPEAGGNMMRDFQFEMPDMPDMPHGAFNMFNRKKLGVRIEDAESENGAKITKIDSAGAAEKAGLKTNDIITEIDGKKINSVDEAREQMSGIEKNDFSIKAKRNGTEMTFNVKMPKKIESADL